MCHCMQARTTYCGTRSSLTIICLLRANNLLGEYISTRGKKFYLYMCKADENRASGGNNNKKIN